MHASLAAEQLSVEGQGLEVCETLKEASLGENMQITSSFPGPFRIRPKKSGKLWEAVPCLPQVARLTVDKYAGESGTS